MADQYVDAIWRQNILLSCHQQIMSNLSLLQNGCDTDEFINSQWTVQKAERDHVLNTHVHMIKPSVCSVGELQNKAARVLTYSSYDADAGNLFEFLGWKNLASQQQIQRATMVYKSLHGLVPDYLCSKFERRETACKK